MGYISMNHLLNKARKGKYAVCAFNIYNLETIQGVLEKSAEMDKDVILAVSESAGKYAGFETLVNIVKPLAQNLQIGVSLHLDHGKDFEVCKKAIDAGFNSVMIDASTLPFEENIKETQRVCEYAKANGDITVEAELGELVGVEDEKFGTQQVYTNPVKAQEFCEKTKIDCLAISIGTSHGINKGVGKPNIRFDIVKEIENKIKLPLVCHGTSMVRSEIVNAINATGGKIKNSQGISIEDIHKLATTTNVCKINMDTDLRLSFTLGVRKVLTEFPETFDCRKFLKQGKEEIKNQVEFAIRVCNN